MTDDAGELAFEPDTIQLRCPADYRQLSLVRAVAANIAAHDGFGVDGVADVQMAVDEACSSLIARAMPEARLDCHFHAFEGRVQVRIRVPTNDPEPVDQHTFGWRVLNTLTDSVGCWVAPSDSGFLTYVELTKLRDHITS